MKIYGGGKRIYGGVGRNSLGRVLNIGPLDHDMKKKIAMPFAHSFSRLKALAIDICHKNLKLEGTSKFQEAHGGSGRSNN